MGFMLHVCKRSIWPWQKHPMNHKNIQSFNYMDDPETTFGLCPGWFSSRLQMKLDIGIQDHLRLSYCLLPARETDFKRLLTAKSVQNAVQMSIWPLKSRENRNQISEDCKEKTSLWIWIKNVSQSCLKQQVSDWAVCRNIFEAGESPSHSTSTSWLHNERKQSYLCVSHW